MPKSDGMNWDEQEPLSGGRAKEQRAPGSEERVGSRTGELRKR
jgi:hypothetical protein